MSDTQDRRGVILLGRQTLHAMLGMPEGYRIVTCWADPRLMGIQVLVESEHLPEVAYGAEAPTLFGQVREHTVLVRIPEKPTEEGGGERTVRFIPEEPAEEGGEHIVRFEPFIRYEWEPEPGAGIGPSLVELGELAEDGAVAE